MQLAAFCPRAQSLESLDDPKVDLDKIDALFWKYLTHCFVEYKYGALHPTPAAAFESLRLSHCVWGH